MTDVAPTPHPSQPQPKRHPFEYQAPTPEQILSLQTMRESFKNTYDLMLVAVPSSAERTLAIRSLEVASMWANKAIVFDGVKYLT